MKIKILLFLTTTLSAAMQAYSPAMHTLLDNMRLYKLQKTTFHAGDLLEHSLWTGRTLAQWFDESNPWTQGLEKFRTVVILGGLFHDVGKAGDLEFVYKSKKLHPRTGFNYLAGIQPFRLSLHKQFDFNSLCEELELSLDDQKMLAILIAMHWDFGGILKNLAENPDTTPEAECRQYLKKLRSMCENINFNNGIPTQALLRAAVAVGAADIRGVQPNTYSNDFLQNLLGKHFGSFYTQPCYQGCNAYKKFEIKKRGFPIRRLLCRMLKS